MYGARTFTKRVNARFKRRCNKQEKSPNRSSEKPERRGVRLNATLGLVGVRTAVGRLSS
jgi:hypothetical protein